MNPLFNGWVGLLEILNSTGKLAITLDGRFTYAKGCGQLGRCGSWIILIQLFWSTLSVRLLHPVVDPSTKQAGGIRVKVPSPQLVPINPIFRRLAVGEVQGGGDVGRDENDSKG